MNWSSWSVVRIFLLAFLIKRFFPYHPAPDNSPDWGWRTTFNGALKTSFRVAQLVRDNHSSLMGIRYLQTVRPPNHAANKFTTEKVINLENFDIHIWRHHDAADDELPTIIFFHGGGWMFGDIPLHRRFYSNIAYETKMTVAAVEYRLSSEAIFPAAFTDCYDAAVFLIENSAKYGIKRDQIVVSGDSAGGQLSLSVGMHLTQNGFNIKGIVAMYPMTQIVSGTTRSYREKDFAITTDGAAWAASQYVYGNLKILQPYQNGQLFNYFEENSALVRERFEYDGEKFNFGTAGKGFDLDEKAKNIILDSRVSPLMAPEEMLRNMPKTHIYAMEHDILRDDAILFHQAAKKAGNQNIQLTVWEGAFHVEQSFSKYWLDRTFMPQSDIWIGEYIQKMKEFATSP